MLKAFSILFVFLSFSAFGQTQKITWKNLQDVNFTDKFSEEEQAYYYYPHFGSKVKALEDKIVYLKGYMFPLGPEDDFYVISRYPYSSCFFCGVGGPESIVQIKFKSKPPEFRMDQVVTIIGKLRLNQNDIYTCNYVFEEAEIYD